MRLLFASLLILLATVVVVATSARRGSLLSLFALYLCPFSSYRASIRCRLRSIGTAPESKCSIYALRRRMSLYLPPSSSSSSSRPVFYLRPRNPLGVRIDSALSAYSPALSFHPRASPPPHLYNSRKEREAKSFLRVVVVVVSAPPFAISITRAHLFLL